MLLLAVLTTIAVRDSIERGANEGTIGNITQGQAEPRPDGELPALWPGGEGPWSGGRDVLGMPEEAIVALATPVQGGANETMYGDLPAYHSRLWPVGLDVLQPSPARRDVGEALSALATPVPGDAAVADIREESGPVVSPSVVRDVPPEPRDSEGPVSVLRATFYGTISDQYGFNCPAQCVTASGDWFVPSGLTAASRLFELGDRLEVCAGEKCIHVVLNDRCRCVGLDLSAGSFEMLSPLSVGIIRVEVRVIE